MLQAMGTQRTIATNRRQSLHHFCTEAHNCTTGTGRYRLVGHRASNIARKHPGTPKKWRFWPCRWGRSLCRSSSCAVPSEPFKGHACSQQFWKAMVRAGTLCRSTWPLKGRNLSPLNRLCPSRPLEKTSADLILPVRRRPHLLVCLCAQVRKVGRLFTMTGTSSNSPALTEMTTEDFTRQPVTQSIQTPHPVWFYI
jgi:hypothetical protein